MNYLTTPNSSQAWNAQEKDFEVGNIFHWEDIKRDV